MINRPKGTYDIFDDEMVFWDFFEENAKKSARVFGFGEIRTPVMEMTELFIRSVGDETDIVQKEMYTFEDKGGRSLTLRPEGTAPAIRAYIENSMMSQGLPKKIFYIGPMFRYERPQAGRQRQFHQFGAEIIGSSTPDADTEIIWLSIFLLKQLFLDNFTLQINHLGCFSDREKYKNALKEYYTSRYEEICPDCKRRSEKNILRVLDCKMDQCAPVKKNAPKIVDYLCKECSNHFEKTKKGLKELGIDYNVNPMLVRGLDYYTGMVFEVKYPFENSTLDILGGGRYDNVVKELGGKETPSVGFACGIERIINVIKSEKVEIPLRGNYDVYILSMGEAAEVEALKIADFLRRRGVSVERDLMSRNLGNQLKFASKSGAKFTVLIGENEIENEVYIVKDMESGVQTTVESSWIENYILEKLEEN